MFKQPAFFQKLIPVFKRKGPVYVWSGAFLLCLLVVLVSLKSSQGYRGNVSEFEVGKVAERDVIAVQTISYRDEQATRLRIEAAERLVPAVFLFSSRETEDIKSQWNHFAFVAEEISLDVDSAQAYQLMLQSIFPGMFSGSTLELLYESGDLRMIIRDSTVILNTILERGVFSMPYSGLEHLNPDIVELIREYDTRIEQERIPFWRLVTKDRVGEALETHLSSGLYSQLFIRLAPNLITPFLKENVFYSPEETERRISEIGANVEPVMRNVEQGKRIIKKGFVITEEEMTELISLRIAMPGINLPMIFTYLLFLVMIFGLLLLFSSKRISGRTLTDREIYLVSVLSALYIAGSVLVRNISVESMPASVLVPTALVMLIPSILINSRLALMLAMALPLGAFLTGSFDAPSYVFALVSGVAASYSLQGAEKRMDLVRAGIINAAANIAAMTAVLLWQNSPAGVFPSSLFWAAFNGIASGMLVLGVLSPLEHVLNAATTFRLIELSDLNAPVLRRLFTLAPGSYSHSMMVANLAEAACQDISANHLLARVGAYYHDLGKMENPGYFVENQADYNPHDDMAPRLSATVIRSHVKLGVEKARQLGLPREVIDIIGEHHGNSVITWFYSKALKQEDQKKTVISKEDFCYPGTPPRSKESAIVMLADVSEAAVRTLGKPTATKLEKFIQELISNKVEQGQLVQSELSFRELETIKNAFVRVLAGYYHSRIEYPKIDGEANNVPPAPSDQSEAPDK